MSMNTRGNPRSNQSLEAVSNTEVDGLSATGVIVISFEDNVVDRPVIHTYRDHLGGVTAVILVFSVASKDSQVVADLVGRLNEVTPLLISASCCSGCTADVWDFVDDVNDKAASERQQTALEKELQEIGAKGIVTARKAPPQETEEVGQQPETDTVDVSVVREVLEEPTDIIIYSCGKNSIGCFENDYQAVKEALAYTFPQTTQIDYVAFCHNIERQGCADPSHMGWNVKNLEAAAISNCFRDPVKGFKQMYERCRGSNGSAFCV